MVHFCPNINTKFDPLETKLKSKHLFRVLMIEERIPFGKKSVRCEKSLQSPVSVITLTFRCLPLNPLKLKWNSNDMEISSEMKYLYCVNVQILFYKSEMLLQIQYPVTNRSTESQVMKMMTSMFQINCHLSFSILGNIIFTCRIVN